MVEILSRLLDLHKNQIYIDFKKIVNINSFTSNIEGIDNMKNALIEIAKRQDINLEIVHSSNKARPHLMYQKELRKDYYAVIGHFDTVHPADSDFNAYDDRGEFIVGPGTNDMKSGLLVAIYSLAILKTLYPNRQIPIKILFNSDEETGSSDSQEIIESEFINAKAGFVFEPGRINGEIVTKRKGIASLDIEVLGKPAHSGVAPWDGINSILASCQIIQKLEALNDYENGIIVGCNQISAGVARNVVPACSKITVDIRFDTMEQKEIIFKNIEDILNEGNSVGAKVKYDLTMGRPALVRNAESIRLSKIYRNISTKLGYSCKEVSTGGVSDGNFISAMGIPVLDGLGAVGDFSHTKQEYIKKDSILYRIKIFVLFMSEILNEEQLNK